MKFFVSLALALFCSCGGVTYDDSPGAVDVVLRPPENVDKVVVNYSESGGPNNIVEKRQITYGREDSQILIESKFINDPNQTTRTRLVAPSEKFRQQLDAWLNAVLELNLSGEYNGVVSAGGSDFPVVNFVLSGPSKTVSVLVNTSAPPSLPFPLGDLYEAFLSGKFQ